MMMKGILSVLLSLMLFFGSIEESFANSDFNDWLNSFMAKAKQEGISDKTLSEALSIIEPIERVIELDRKQPEKTVTFSEYLDRVISDYRIRKGKELYKKHYQKLSEVEKKYGVNPAYVISLWGMETSYGTYTGGFDVLSSLATLAWEGRRSEFFEKELINALKIIDQKHISATQMKGSWAGAMGQSQFMPSSFLNFAVDHDNDGKKDIWNNTDDVFASISNYLASHGWHSDERWGRKIILPKNFPSELMGLDIQKNLVEWRDMGITIDGVKPIPVSQGMIASVIAPDGENGQAFLVYNNFRVLMKWNKSTYFATSVGLLAEEIMR